MCEVCGWLLVVVLGWVGVGVCVGGLWLLWWWVVFGLGGVLFGVCGLVGVLLVLVVWCV